MRYIDIGGEVIPKHCIYGPRPKEGIVFNNYEWWSITDNLVKEQREKEMAAVLRAKEEAKRDISFQMTCTWNNTLASIKTQGNQKRLEKLEKEKQDRIDQYQEILKNRKEEKAKIVEKVKKVLFEEKDAVKTLNSAVLFSTVLAERQKQIEMKKLLEDEEAKKEEERVLEMKKDVAEYERELYQEKLKNLAKLEILKQDLEAQILEQQKKEKGGAAELEALKQDLKNMVIEGEKIHQCNMNEKEFRKTFAAKYMRKGERILQHERNLALEEDEENEINKIYLAYEKKFKKERIEREEKMKNDRIEQRVKMSELLAQKMQSKAMEEEESYLSALAEKEEQAKKEEEEKKEKQRQALADLLEGKRKAEEKRAREIYIQKEAKKWDIMQLCRSAELDNEWREWYAKEKAKQEREELEANQKIAKENRERLEKELQEWLAPLEDETKDKEELLQYIQEVLDFAKEYNLPEGSLLTTISEIKQEYGIEDEIRKDMDEKRKQREAQQRGSRKSKPVGYGCYCFKY